MVFQVKWKANRKWVLGTRSLLIQLSSTRLCLDWFLCSPYFFSLSLSFSLPRTHSHVHFSLSFFFLIFIYLFLAALGLRCCTRAFSSCGVRASRCGGFSCCGAWALSTWASVVVAHGLSSCGSQALEHRLSSCGAQA